MENGLVGKETGLSESRKDRCLFALKTEPAYYSNYSNQPKDFTFTAWHILSLLRQPNHSTITSIPSLWVTLMQANSIEENTLLGTP